MTTSYYGEGILFLTIRFQGSLLLQGEHQAIYEGSVPMTQTATRPQLQQWGLFNMRSGEDRHPNYITIQNKTQWEKQLRKMNESSVTCGAVSSSLTYMWSCMLKEGSEGKNIWEKIMAENISDLMKTMNGSKKLNKLQAE